MVLSACTGGCLDTMQPPKEEQKLKKPKQKNNPKL